MVLKITSGSRVCTTNEISGRRQFLGNISSVTFAAHNDVKECNIFAAIKSLMITSFPKSLIKGGGQRMLPKVPTLIPPGDFLTLSFGLHAMGK